ncbi:hypothetical protein CJ255_12340 [Candidatus Viridilinea mediisalina]|uniref:Uncharacterized protein n=2 Tax=Candidatus Viridilinea mediisalina TaxID=2024553 RepID=A0A2A6RIA8_9CHLR|nr:hypothetical protein CJ255_12340 [Candidatus Viridilinea mediisalina]
MWLNWLLLVAVPGALLVCTFHCLFAHYLLPQTNTPQGQASPFLCGHFFTVENPTAQPPPLSPSVFQGLIQALATIAAGFAILLVRCNPVFLAPSPLYTRLGEPPPAPPPQW